MPDTPLVAAAKRLKFQQMFEDYQMNMFEHFSMKTRNNSIYKLYTLRTTIRRLEGAYYSFTPTREARTAYDKAISTVLASLSTIITEISDNRKTTRICKDCKESITGRPNKAKPVVFNSTCPICFQTTELYTISKTYFHQKVPRPIPQEPTTTEIDISSSEWFITL